MLAVVGEVRFSKDGRRFVAGEVASRDNVGACRVCLFGGVAFAAGKLLLDLLLDGGAALLIQLPSSSGVSILQQPAVIQSGVARFFSA